jgi:hypothetical protein
MRWPLIIVAVAITALLASAATVGAERLITGADIKDGSITSRDIKPGSLGSDRFERAARHNIYVSKAKRARQSDVPITTNNFVTVASVTVPPGTYALQAETTVANYTDSSVTCTLTDNRNVLTGAQFGQLIAMPATQPNPAIPVTIIGYATYTSQATVMLQCAQGLSPANALAMWGTIIAEQVTSVVGD